VDIPFGVVVFFAYEGEDPQSRNPCSSGYSFRREPKSSGVQDILSGRNPCSSGYSFRRADIHAYNDYALRVAILVLVDIPFGVDAGANVHADNDYGRNPCSSGYSFRSAGNLQITPPGGWSQSLF